MVVMWVIFVMLAMVIVVNMVVRRGQDRTGLGGERNMKQGILVNSITSKLFLKLMYASGSTGHFFADHYSQSGLTQLKFRQEN